MLKQFRCDLQKAMSNGDCSNYHFLASVFFPSYRGTAESRRAGMGIPLHSIRGFLESAGNCLFHPWYCGAIRGLFSLFIRLRS